MKLRQSDTVFKSCGAFSILIFIWMFAFILSSPLFIYNTQHNISLNIFPHELQIEMDESIKNSISSSSTHTTTTHTSSTHTTTTHIMPTYSTQAFNRTNNQSFMAMPHNDSYLVVNQTSANDHLEISKTLKIYHCVEIWPYQSRIVYSYSALLIQYILPILIVGIAYSSIWWKLNNQRKKLKNHTRSHLLSPTIKHEQMDSKSQTKSKSDEVSCIQFLL